MSKWEALKRYCQEQIDLTIKICPSFNKPGHSRLREDCAYAMKYYNAVLVKMKELEKHVKA